MAQAMQHASFVKAFDACVGHAENFTYRGVTLKLNQRKDGSFIFDKTTLPDGSTYIPNIYGKPTREAAEESARKAIDDYFKKQ